MKQYENGTNGSAMGFLFGMVVGAVAGAGVALLLAPKSGAELRNDLSESMGNLKDSASRRIRDVKDRASAGWNEVQSAAAGATKAASERSI
jgi:gas vesicle protein